MIKLNNKKVAPQGNSLTIIKWYIRKDLIPTTTLYLHKDLIAITITWYLHKDLVPQHYNGTPPPTF